MTKPRILVARAIFPDIVERLRAHFEVDAGSIAREARAALALR
mgnify:CR=1 FL=1